MGEYAVTNIEKRIDLLESILRELAGAIASGDAGKLHAIKAWRAATGTTLMDAKDYIEAISAGEMTSSEFEAKFNRLGEELNAVNPRRHIDELVDQGLETELAHLCEILQSTRVLHAQVVKAYEDVLKRNDRLIAAMKFVIDELEEDQEADDGQPNKAMRLSSELKEAMYGPGAF